MAAWETRRARLSGFNARVARSDAMAQPYGYRVLRRAEWPKVSNYDTIVL
jgi:hypothetical protein